MNTNRKKQNLSTHPKVKIKCSKIPVMYRGLYLTAMEGKSLRAAATMTCLECVGHTRLDVAMCQSVTCALYLYRPYTDYKNQAIEEADSCAESTNVVQADESTDS